MPPEKHALLSASSASRWLKCTAAPRFEEGLPENTSEYAEEGRLAHAIGELKVLKKCTPMSTRTYNTRLNKLKKNPLYDPEMDKTTDLYLEHITEQVMDYDEALVYDRKPKTLSELEKLMGKAEFAEKIGGFVTKPLGKPTLAPASDKREAYAPATSDFSGVVDG